MFDFKGKYLNVGGSAPSTEVAQVGQRVPSARALGVVVDIVDAGLQTRGKCRVGGCKHHRPTWVNCDTHLEHRRGRRAVRRAREAGHSKPCDPLNDDGRSRGMMKCLSAERIKLIWAGWSLIGVSRRMKLIRLDISP